MPLCRLFLRPLLHSRALQPCQCTRLCRAPCRDIRAGLRSAGTAFRQRRQHDTYSNGLDLTNVSADSTYLDFILGTEEGTSTPLGGTARDSNAGKAASVTTPKPRPLERYHQQKAVTDARIPRTEPRKAPARRTRKRVRRISTHHSSAHSKISCATWAANLEYHSLRAQGHRLQSKYVSIRSSTRSKNYFSRYWNTNFARIQSVFDNANTYSGTIGKTIPSLNPRTNEWVKLVIEHLNHGSKPVQIGPLLHKDHKRAISRWQSVALWLLYSDPERMLEFLEASSAVPNPPISCLEDSLQYLAKYFAHDMKPRTVVWQKLYDIFITIAYERTDERLWMQSSFFRLLIQRCTDKQVQELYRTIKTRHVRVSWHTYLHFATYFAKHEHFEQSLDAILEAKDTGATLDSYAFRSNCATLLRTAIRQPGGLRVTMRIVSNLVKIGLPLNTRLCNIVMLNAVEAGDLKTAFSVYNSLVENGLEADAYTYTILLKGCRANIDDAETLNTTIRSAIEGTNVTQNIVLATEILLCLALHHTKHGPEKAFDTVLDAYVQLFDLKPLQTLGLPLPRVSQSDKPASEKLQPNDHTISIVLATYLDDHFMHNQSTSPIYEIYQRLHTLTEAGEEPFNMLAKTDHCANMFLKSFTRTKRGLLHAAEVIKDMQNGLPTNAKVQQCPPTIQSWSIFLHGFTRHKQLQLAEQVLTFIRAQGLQPNHVTWTSLISGYASIQDLDRVLDTIRRGEVDGAVWDDWTMSGLRNLVNQRKLHEECRKQRLAASLDFTQEIRDGLGIRLSSAST